MSTAEKLMAVLAKAKANLLTVDIKERGDGDIIATISDGGYVSESFITPSLEGLVRGIEIRVESMQLIPL